MNKKEIEKPDVVDDDLSGVQLVYDVWIAEVYVGRLARRWGMPCTMNDKRVTMHIATARINQHETRLVQI